MADHYKEAAMSAPPISVGALTLFGFPLQEWVLLCTLIYTLFLIVDKLPTVLARAQQAAAFIRRLLNGSK